MKCKAIGQIKVATKVDSIDVLRMCQLVSQRVIYYVSLWLLYM